MPTLQDLRARAGRMHARFLRRNLILYGYGIFGIITGICILGSNIYPDQLVPGVFMLGAHVFVLWQVWRRFMPRQLPPQATGQSVLQFYRQELTRQQAAVNKAWLWYIAPFMPPFIWQLAVWWHGIDFNTPGGVASAKGLVMVVVTGVFFWSWVWVLFSRHATRLQLELERLRSVTAE
ncbi:MAG: hypothetical protein ABW110_07205 [Steroidobacteraceae bacterium]